MIKLLIADDNFDFVKTIFNKISNNDIYDFKITKISSNGEETFNYILNNDIDVVLLDLEMPKLTRIRNIGKIKRYS